MSRRQRSGYVKERRRKSGSRYTALYLSAPGTYLSAGTFDSEEEAEAAWQDQAHALRNGTHADPRKGRTPFRDFTAIFLDVTAVQKANTISAYRDTIRAQLIPAFGDMPLMDITPEVVTRWVRKLKEDHYAASSIRTWKGQLSGVLQTAVLMRYLVVNPCTGVKTPKSPPRRIRALSPEAFESLYKAVPGPVAGMLIELAVHSGCRWGEITELRGRDIKDDPDCDTRVFLELTRAVIDIGAEDNPAQDGGRFYVEDTTKGGHDRKIGLSESMTDKLLGYMDTHSISEDDLLFPLSRLDQELIGLREPTLLKILPNDLGFTEPNAAGRKYRHGSMVGYGPGKCRCEWCRFAVASYRQKRRMSGRDLKPRKNSKRGANLTNHLPRDWFRRHVWGPVLEEADLRSKVVFHDLRHTHATWLARSHKVDIERLRERMGHRSIVTTQQYISASTIVDTTAADAIEEALAAPARRVARTERHSRRSAEPIT